MKLYIWKGFDHEDLDANDFCAVAVMAESLQEAREIAFASYIKDCEGEHKKEIKRFLAAEPTEIYDMPAASWF